MRDFFPQFLELDWDLDSRVMLDLLELIRTPDRVEKLDIEAIDEVLRRCRLHSAEEVLEILGAEAPPLDSEVVEAASANARHQIDQLRAALRAQNTWSEKVEELLEDIAEKQKAGELPTAFQDKQTRRSASADAFYGDEPSQSPHRSDIEIELSVPGVGTTTLAGLFGEAFPGDCPWRAGITAPSVDRSRHRKERTNRRQRRSPGRSSVAAMRAIIT